MENWLGIESHPTDEYIHWAERKPQDKMKELRTAYDKIKDAGLLKELEILTDASYDNARNEAADDAAGEDI